jgi:hypothetical protein
MNLFVTFGSIDERDAFLAQLRSDWPAMADRAHTTKRRPDAIFEHLDDADRQRLVAIVGVRGKIHEDVQFAPFHPGR